MLKQKNTWRQGDVGVGCAISYFMKKGCVVSIPISESTDYDLIVDFGDGVLKRVQVKTTTYKRNSRYLVELRTKQMGKVTKRFSESDADLLFVVTEDEDLYLIPIGVCPTNALSLGKKYEEWKL